MPDLNALDPDAVLVPAFPPPSLGGDILIAVSRERQLRDRRRRRRTALTAAAAAAGVLALSGGGYLLGQRGAAQQAADRRPLPTASPTTTPAVPLVPTEPVRLAPATPGISVTDAYLIPHTWGVEVKFVANGLLLGQTYHSAFRLTDGSTQPGGQFLGVGATSLKCAMQSAVLRKDLVAFMIFDASNRLILSAAIPT